MPRTSSAGTGKKSSSNSSQSLNFLYQGIALFLLILIISFLLTFIVLIIVPNESTDIFNRISQIVIKFIYAIFGIVLLAVSFVMEFLNWISNLTGLHIFNFDVEYYRATAFANMQQVYDFLTCLTQGGSSCS